MGLGFQDSSSSLFILEVGFVPLEPHRPCGYIGHTVAEPVSVDSEKSTRAGEKQSQTVLICVIMMWNLIDPSSKKLFKFKMINDKKLLKFKLIKIGFTN